MNKIPGKKKQEKCYLCGQAKTARHMLEYEKSGYRIQKVWYKTIMRTIEHTKSAVKKMAKAIVYTVEERETLKKLMNG